MGRNNLLQMRTRKDKMKSLPHVPKKEDKDDQACGGCFFITSQGAPKPKPSSFKYF